MARAENAPMDKSTGLMALLGGLLMMGGMIVALRWTFGTGRNHVSPHVEDPDDPTGDGLLEEVSRVPTRTAAHILQRRLVDAGIRATIGRGDGAYRLLVFPADLVNARIVLSRSALE